MKKNPASDLPLRYEQVAEAANRIKGIIWGTPSEYCHFLSDHCSANVFFKLENRQRTGSFKVRGAANFIMMRNREDLQNGLVAASMGNHGQAVSLIGQIIKIPVTIFAPVGASPLKVARIRRLGADVVLVGDQYEDSVSAAESFARKNDALAVPAFEDPEVMAGQGTCGLEMAAQIPDLDLVLVPVGGGGLICGIAAALARVSPNTRLIGVQSSKADTMRQCLEKGEVFLPKAEPTLADGLAGGICEMTFQMVRALVDDVVAVPEEELAPSIARAAIEGKEILEGSAACCIAALLFNHIEVKPRSNVGVVLSGRNIDDSVLATILQNYLKG